MSIREAMYYAQYSTCKKRKVGCVIVKKNEIIAYGFNHGYEEKCSCQFTEKNPHVLHAEAMALQGTDDLYKGAELYVTYQPCLKCAELIVHKKIKTVFYAQANACKNSIDFLNKNKVRTYALA